MRRQIAILAAMFVAINSPSYAETDFIIPEQCTSGATGAASSDLATDGDQPVVNVYKLADTSKFATLVKIETDGDSNWYVIVDAPQTDTYVIQTVYTPFLVTYQSKDLAKGISRTIQLALPGLSITDKTVKSFDVALGDTLANAFVEFEPYVDALDPFTMQADASGNLEVLCYTTYRNGQAITVYNKDNDFYNTGVLNGDGSITWSPTDSTTAQSEGVRPRADDVTSQTQNTEKK